MDRAALAKAMNKAIGDEAVDAPLRYLDTGYPPLNYIMSGRYDGGFVAGRLYEISGPSMSGKTALATKIMMEAQAQDGYAIFIDWERAFSTKLAEQLGLKITPDYFAYHRADTWESGNTIAMKLAQEARAAGVTGPIVAVFDSIAQAIPASMLYDKEGKEREIDEFTMNDTTALARVTSTTLKVIARLVEKLDVCAIYLNQLRTKPGVAYGDPTTTPGGVAMEYYASGRLRLNKAQIKDAKTKDFLGQDITLKNTKSKFTAPFKDCKLRLMFTGTDGAAYFDTTLSLVEHLIDEEILKKLPGGYVDWKGEKLYPKDLAAKLKGKEKELEALLPKTA